MNAGDFIGATAKVQSVCKQIGGLHPHPDVTSKQWGAWLMGFPGGLRVPRARQCKECGGKMQEKKGKYGAFFGCENYPQCKNTERLTIV